MNFVRHAWLFLRGQFKQKAEGKARGKARAGVPKPTLPCLLTLADRILQRPGRSG